MRVRSIDLLLQLLLQGSEDMALGFVRRGDDLGPAGAYVRQGERAGEDAARCDFGKIFDELIWV